MLSFSPLIDHNMKKQNPDYRKHFMVVLNVVPESARGPDGMPVPISSNSSAFPAAHGSSQSVRPPTTSSSPTMPDLFAPFGPVRPPSAAMPHQGVPNDWLQVSCARSYLTR
jgi:hypothetical protein